MWPGWAAQVGIVPLGWASLELSGKAIGVDRERHALTLRVCGEFRDVSGVSITLQQAVRLFDLSQDVCEDLLVSMVERGLLDVTLDGAYRYRAHPQKAN